MAKNKEFRNNPISLNISDAMKARVTAYCERKELTLSEMARIAIVELLEKAEVVDRG